MTRGSDKSKVMSSILGVLPYHLSRQRSQAMRRRRTYLWRCLELAKCLFGREASLGQIPQNKIECRKLWQVLRS